jgi:2'-hydroxyisoflavone reductase
MRRVLVLGGGGFVGGAVVAEGLRRGWSVTVFNRGLHGSVPEGALRLRGDRTLPGGLRPLTGRPAGDNGAAYWDVVVDTWDGAPKYVLSAAETLKDSAAHYVYVSSRSVYREPVEHGADEGAPVVDAAPDDADGDYARLKSGAELAVLQAFGERALIARAGLILGPGEDIGRLPWWLLRAARGGDMLAPGPPDLPLQCLDVRDLAGWILDRGAARLSGTFNVHSRQGHTTMGELLAHCVSVTDNRAALRFVTPEALLDAGVEPWNELPIWIPEGHEYRWLHTGDASRAHAAGLRCRPVAETVADTWAWLCEAGEVPTRAGRPSRTRVGLDPDREAALLAEINGKQSGS